MIELTFDYLKTLPTIRDLREVITTANTCERIEGGITNTPQGNPFSSRKATFTSFWDASSLTPLAQDFIDEVEYSIEDQTDLNLTKCLRRLNNESRVMPLWFNKVKGKSEPEIYSSLSGSITLNSRREDES